MGGKKHFLKKIRQTKQRRRCVHYFAILGICSFLLLTGFSSGFVGLVTQDKIRDVTGYESYEKNIACISEDTGLEVYCVSTDESVTISYVIHGFDVEEVVIDKEIFYQFRLEREAVSLISGSPEVPLVARSIIIPDDGGTEVAVVDMKYVEYQDISVVPSKGNLCRTKHPVPSAVPYEFGEVYGVDAWYPEDIVRLRDPYILRDFRGQVVELYPIQYNPVRSTVRLYTEITVEVTPVKDSEAINVFYRTGPLTSVQRDFARIYDRQFLNYHQVLSNAKYTPVEEEGNMLVITHDNFYSLMLPFVDWKNLKGIPTQLVKVSEIGSTTTAIKNYITSYYHTQGLTFVLLVGDQHHIPTFTSFSAASDPTYSFIVGSDYYPDLFVGRFSAANSAHVQTQVERSLYYEQNPEGDWREMATGIASSEGGGNLGYNGLADWQHMRILRNRLYDFGYTWVDEFYDGSQGGDDAPGNPTAAMVSSAFNEGRHIANYCGHGWYDSLSTSGFSRSHIHALVNINKLAFFITVACLPGAFTSVTECFAEAWLRATHNGQPTGGIGAFSSARSQLWSPPMAAQDEMMHVYTETYPNNVKTTMGGIAFNGCMFMNDLYGTDGYRETAAWHLFGDPSLDLSASFSSWTETEVVSTQSTSTSCFPSLAVDKSGTVHVAWQDFTNYNGCGTDADIFYKSKPAGGSWTTTEVVSTESTEWSYRPVLTVDALGTVHVAWEDSTPYQGSGSDRDIFYKSKPAGGSWTTTEVVSTESTGNSYNASLVVDKSGTVHVAWDDSTPYQGSGSDRDIFYKRKADGMWSTTEVVSTESWSDSFRPCLFVDRWYRLHVAWQDSTDYEGCGTDSDIFYKRNVDGSWTTTEVVSTQSTGKSWFASLFVDSLGSVYVAWSDDTDYEGSGSDYDILYKRSRYGAGWGATEVVSTQSTSSSYFPSLAVDRYETVHVAWYDSTNYGGSGSDWDIFYKYRTYEVGGGGRWSTTEVVSTESTGWSFNPSLVVDALGMVHVAWEDNTYYGGSGTDLDIFYKYRTAAGQQVIVHGDCFYQNMNPVYPVSVEIHNMNTGATWNALTQDNFYSQLLQPEEVSAGHILRYIARDAQGSVNVTDHVITCNELSVGMISRNLFLDVHYRDLNSFPMHISTVSTGAAVIKMMLDYLRWNSTTDPVGPPSVFSEQDLFDSYNVGGIFTESRIQHAMNTVINTQFPVPPEYEHMHGTAYYGYWFSPHRYDTALDALRSAALWLDYDVSGMNDFRSLPVPRPGHTHHAPVAVPTLGTYDNWMVICGIHTDGTFWDTSNPGYHTIKPSPVVLYGLWITDPDAGGLGNNWYLTTQYFMDNYFDAMTVGDFVGQYIVVVDPPDVGLSDEELEVMVKRNTISLGKQVSATPQQLRLVRSAARFGLSDAVNPLVMELASQALSRVHPDAFTSPTGVQMVGSEYAVSFGNGMQVYLDESLTFTRLWKP